MKKELMYLTVLILLGIVEGFISLWIIVEFILYLFKDIPFNWWSIYSFIINVIVLISVVFIPIIVENKIRKRKMKLLKNQKS